MSLRLEEIAVRFGCELKGDPNASVTHVATLAKATAGSISFLANKGYRSQLSTTEATAVILTAADVADCQVNSLITENPYEVYARVTQVLFPERQLLPGLHSAACIDKSSSIPESCEIAAGAVIAENVVLGENVYVGANCVIAENVCIGDGTRLIANVSIYKDVRIGCRCLVHAGTVIGSDGFGMAPSATGWVKVPQVGSVILGDDVEIGANCTVDRGAIGDTCIGNDVKIDNLVQIAHNVVIGDHSALAGQVGVAGSAIIGANCMIGGAAAISGHLEIADNVSIMGRATVTRSIAAAGVYSSVWPTQEAGAWRKMVARVKRLDSMAKRLKELERSIGKLVSPKDKTE